MPFLSLWAAAPTALALLVSTSDALRSQAAVAVPVSAHEAAPGPKIFFLFLVNRQLASEDIWLKFFPPARQGIDYEVIVHCQDEPHCKKSFRSPDVFRVIPTVASKWCDDLVSPMDALLAAGLETSKGNPRDQFVFLSDTTVPVKPFHEVYKNLVGAVEGSPPESSFCVTPDNWWATKDIEHQRPHLAIKHYQWVVLTRDHAVRVVNSRKDFRNLTDTLTPLHSWAGPALTSAIQHTIGHWKKLRLHPTGCLDEYLYFALVFGFPQSYRGHPQGMTHARVKFNDDLNSEDLTARAPSAEPDLRIHGFRGSPLTVHGEAARDFQGACHTFDFFGYGRDFQVLVDLMQADGTTQIELPQHGKFHPARFQTLTPASLTQLRKSDYLFARKVDNNTQFKGPGEMPLAEAFNSFIFTNMTH
jgi:hypothetical protein